MKLMERWPNLFIVGPPKTGTASLYNYLDSVPDIFMSKKKEPRYFSQSSSKMKDIFRISDKSKYLKLFEGAKNEKIIGEASTSYFGDPSAPELIKEVSPNAYIIISLRDPVERTHSAYFWHRKYGRLRPSFHDELEFELTHKEDFTKPSLRLQTGLYSHGIKRYLKVFDPKQVKILIFEEWVKDTKNTVNELIRFLGLNYDLADVIQETYNPYSMSRGMISQKILGSSRIRKVSTSLLPNSTKDFLKKILVKKDTKPKMHEDDREKLIEFYQNDVRELEKLLGHKLPWPNFQN